MRQEFWDQRKAKISECAYLGMTISEAAADTGFSRKTVTNYAEKFGIKFSSQSKASALIVAEIRACADKGLTRAQAAERLGISQHYLGSIARAEQIHFVHALKGSIDRDRAEAMAAMFAGGKTLQDVGDVFGVTRERVRQIIKSASGLRGEDGGQRFRADVRRAQRRAASEVACWTKYGCSRAQLAELKKIGGENAGARSPIIAYRNQKGSATTRGIEWNIKLWDWWMVWQRSGKWEQRGRDRGSYVMCRFGDEGAYEVGNVYIATTSHNCSFQPNHPNRKNPYLTEVAA